MVFSPHSIRLDSTVQEEGEEEGGEEVGMSTTTRNSFDRMLENMESENIRNGGNHTPVGGGSTASPPPRYTSVASYTNIFTSSHRRRSPSTVSPITAATRGTISQPLALSRSAPDLARRYRDSETIGTGYDLENQEFGITNHRAGGSSLPTRKKTSGFSNIFSKVGRKRTKPTPSPLTLQSGNIVLTPRTNRASYQRGNYLPSSPVISTPLTTPRQQSYFTVPLLEPRSSQDSDVVSSPFEFPPSNNNPGPKGFFSRSGSTTPRNHAGPSSQYLNPTSSREQEEYFPPSPFLPSSIRVPSKTPPISRTPSILTPPRTNSDNLLSVSSTPTISIRRPSIPDSPPNSIHQPQPKRTKFTQKNSALESKTSSLGSSFQGLDHSRSSSSGWTVMLQEIGRSETSGTLNEFRDENGFPWFAVEGSEDSTTGRIGFEFEDISTSQMHLRIDKKEKGKGRATDQDSIVVHVRVVGEQDRQSYFSTTTGNSSRISIISDEESDATSDKHPFHYLLSALEETKASPATTNDENLADSSSTKKTRSPGLQPLRLLSSSPIDIFTRPKSTKRVNSERHQSVPNLLSSSDSSTLDVVELKGKISTHTSSSSVGATTTSSGNLSGMESSPNILPSPDTIKSFFWPRRPSDELRRIASAEQDEELVQYSTTLPLSVPIRSLPSSPEASTSTQNVSKGVQTDFIPFPSQSFIIPPIISYSPPSPSFTLPTSPTLLSPIKLRLLPMNISRPSPSSSLKVSYNHSSGSFTPSTILDEEEEEKQAGVLPEAVVKKEVEAEEKEEEGVMMKKLMEKNEALEWEVERLRKVVGVLIGLEE